MTTRNVAMRAHMPLLVLAFILFFIVSCASSTTGVDKVIREMTLCKKANHSAARVTNDPALLEIARTVADEPAPKGGILLCTIPNQLYPTAESATLLDNTEHPTLVIWHEDRLFKELDIKTVRFIIAHEFGHYIVRVACPTNERSYYIFCEHTVDRVAASVVGLPDAASGLEQLLRYMTKRGAAPLAIGMVKERIELLKKHAND